jgi:mannitol-1-phosphate 5-dehydrogenase
MNAIMYGAGNIGRGFIGQLFYQSGYSTIFVDVNEEIVDLLNAKGQYPIKIVSNELCEEIIIKNVSAINGMDIETTAQAIADCEIMCTAVGVNVLPGIVSNIARGIEKRFKESQKPLNIIICENLIGADDYLRGLIKGELDEKYHSYIDNKIGFVEASVGRMVPIMTEKMKEDNPLKVWVEPFCTLPVDKDAFKEGVPRIKNMIPSSPFEYHIRSKLYLHNMGHSLTAYLGNLKGYKYIWEAIADDSIKKICIDAMKSSAIALSIEYKKDKSEVLEYAQNLISRFGNKHLGDTVERVGKDIKRKLSPNDRLVGAAMLCKRLNIDNDSILEGIAAALRFSSDDSGTNEVIRILNDEGIEAALTKICGLKEGSNEYAKVISKYNNNERRDV